MPSRRNYKKYESAYQCHCGITLRTGREIVLKKVTQWQTYSGLLEGFPHRSLNDRLIKHAKENAKALFHCKEPYIIAPIITPLEIPNEMDHSDTFPILTPESLLMVTCIGEFYSIKPARDEAMHGSSLVISWMQPEFSPTIHEEIIQEIEKLDWTSLSQDFEY